MKHVFVGMSGGVDSSVTAALLKEQGYRVTGVYMKNWAQDIGDWHCPWREDLADAKRVAVQLGIDFTIFDFQAEYKQKVVDYLIEGYQAGITPNPDIMCNQEVKFRLFLDAALEAGADAIATGHYARILQGKSEQFELHRAFDETKDQTYFLHRMPPEALAKTLFPLGEIKKTEVRQRAKDLGLVTAAKKDSVGICFVGKVGIKEFLQNFVATEPGSIVDQHGKAIGLHDGALFYTIGQRHGLNVGGGLPYYVTHKDMHTNQVFVTTDLDDPQLWTSQFSLQAATWLNDEPSSTITYQIQTRHLAPTSAGTIDNATIQLEDPQRAITPGQSTVVYEGSRVVGGGIIGQTA